MKWHIDSGLRIFEIDGVIMAFVSREGYARVYYNTVHEGILIKYPSQDKAVADINKAWGVDG